LFNKDGKFHVYGNGMTGLTYQMSSPLRRSPREPFLGTLHGLAGEPGQINVPARPAECS